MTRTATLTGLTLLADQAITAFASHDITTFQAALDALENEGWDSTLIPVESRVHSIVIDRLGDVCTFDDLLGLAADIATHLARDINVDRYTVEFILRRFYGDETLTNALTLNVLQTLELAIAGAIKALPATT